MSTCDLCLPEIAMASRKLFALCDDPPTTVWVCLPHALMYSSKEEYVVGTESTIEKLWEEHRIRRMHYGEREIYLMNKVPPDVWVVTTTSNGISENGDYVSLEEALAEFVELWQGKAKFDSIEIAPLWNEDWHKDVS